MRFALLIFCFLITGCRTMAPGRYQQRFVVHPEDMPRFKADQQRCFEVAAIAHGGRDLQTACLREIGYKYEVTRD